MNINERKLCDNCFNVMLGEPCPHCGYKKSKYKPEFGVLPVGTVLKSRYQIGLVLGRGGFGVTYKAYDTVAKKIVAVKEYYPNGIVYRDIGTTGVSVSGNKNQESFQTGASKFYEEAKTVARFNGNPNIVGVFEFFYENNTVYYAMEYLNGCDLKVFIKANGGKLSQGKLLTIVNNITDGLVITHSLNVLHRDISPDNIFILQNGEMKLIDFGAARQVFAEQSKSLSVILKQGFAPLEQYQRRGKQGPWTDIYALGATCYYALTGKVMDDATERIDDADIGQAEDYGVDPEFWSIIEKCVAPKAENRYQTVLELKSALSQLSVVPVPLTEHEPQAGVRVPYADDAVVSGRSGDSAAAASATGRVAEDIGATVAADEAGEDIGATVAVDGAGEDIGATVAVDGAGEDIGATVAVDGAGEDIGATVAVDETGHGNRINVPAFLRSKKGILCIAAVAGVLLLVGVGIFITVSGRGGRRPLGTGGSISAGKATDEAEGTTQQQGPSQSTDKEQESNPTDIGLPSQGATSGDETLPQPPVPTQGGSTTQPPVPTQGGSTTQPPVPTQGGSTTQPPVPTQGGSTTQPPVPTQGGSTTQPVSVTNQPYTVSVELYGEICSYTGVYTGEWKAGMPNGQGTFTADSAYYDIQHRYIYISGSWSNGKLSGHGTHAEVLCQGFAANFSNTDWKPYDMVAITVGEWINGSANGQMTYYEGSGGSYGIPGMIWRGTMTNGDWDDYEEEEWNYYLRL